jgi:hypothetical protein
VEATTYIAVYGNGSWGAESKTHAADASTGAGLNYRPHDVRFKSVCGQRYCMAAPNSRTFDSIMEFDQCQRCARIVAKRKQPA